MEDFRRINKEIFRKLDQLFTTVIVTGISSVIAIILGVGAINTAIVNNMFASYNEGKARAIAPPISPLLHRLFSGSSFPPERDWR